MNDKQNALEIIHFGKPERVMINIPSYRIAYHGSNHQGYDDIGMENGHDRPVGSRWTDIWGTGWHKEYPDVMGFPKVYPLAETTALRSYKWPDPDDERLCAAIYKSAGEFSKNEDLLMIGSHRDTLWEKSYMLVGMENMMEYFYTEPEYVREILHNIMNFQMGIARHYIKAGVEIAGMGDDMGTQNNLLLGMKIFKEFLEPEYIRLFNFYKSKKVLVNFHSCGHIEPLLDSFIKLGVNILNPVQATANNLENVIKITNRKMALSGGVSTEIIMNGPFERIRQSVKIAISILGRDGGYFCSPDQGMPFPKENYSAFENAVTEYGRY